MAIELYPSSFRCDCGHESNFFENTIREMEKMSIHKRAALGDGGDNKHTIVFFKGKAIEIICPKLRNCKITDSQ
ncbi:MAG: hypothetical protein KME32_26180 [Mojavia pulchra JT2-VF2]|uniref:Uncharacterized protein n=1 Tax=Mojavia pulchra JT2-VF2 TaxID=287848 RepID=A0A951Q5K1_9NOST|nr:hypothetical protein [Mojavia pulchra JT2-VF2]